jgi:NhaA family Na+:H+ antiporter
LACTVAALLLANSSWSAAYARIWQTRVGFAVADFELFKPLLLWINDGLMTIFFFVVGLEIKHELVAGELQDRRKAALPIVAALGGMVFPAMVYLLFQIGEEGQSGWGIPVATDIAFVVGFLALLGSRVPFGLQIMLLTLAIADDIGAVLVIAFFYSGEISLPALGFAAVGIGLTYFFNGIGVRRMAVYVVVGAGIWLAFLKSGVHPTMAGVLLGLLTPASAWVGDRTLTDVLSDVLQRLHLISNSGEEARDHRRQALGLLAMSAREGISPLERLELGLQPWVAFLIIPLFALANAGVAVELASLQSPVALAVAAGLVLGKPIGIVLFSWAAVKLSLARLPSGVNWKIMLGAGCLAGIGFTMSIFIAGLALERNLLEAGKIGTLIGSALSAIIGCVLLVFFLPKRRQAEIATDAAIEQERKPKN